MLHWSNISCSMQLFTAPLIFFLIYWDNRWLTHLLYRWHFLNQASRQWLLRDTFGGWVTRSCTVYGEFASENSSKRPPGFSSEKRKEKRSQTNPGKSRLRWSHWLQEFSRFILASRQRILLVMAGCPGWRRGHICHAEGESFAQGWSVFSSVTFRHLIGNGPGS